MVPITVLGYTFQFTKIQAITALILVLIICGCLAIAMWIKLYNILNTWHDYDDCKSLRVMYNVNLREVPAPVGCVITVIRSGAIVKVDPNQNTQDVITTGYIKVRYRSHNGYVLRSALSELD